MAGQLYNPVCAPSFLGVGTRCETRRAGRVQIPFAVRPIRPPPSDKFPATVGDPNEGMSAGTHPTQQLTTIEACPLEGLPSPNADPIDRFSTEPDLI